MLFVSSTSVYPDEPRLMREADAVQQPRRGFGRAAGRGPLCAALRASGAARWCAWAASSGRAGPPGRFLAGRRDLPQGNAPDNLLHLTDAVGVLSSHYSAQCLGPHLQCVRGRAPVAARLLPRRRRATSAWSRPLFCPKPAPAAKPLTAAWCASCVPYAFQHDDVLAALPYC
ncbi:MAG: hypothetical protein WKG07_04885 [Hymenobacter sp.]